MRQIDRLIAAIGDEATDALVRLFGGRRIRVPNKESMRIARNRERRNAAIVADCERYTYREVARRHGVSIRTVQRIAKIA